MNIRPILITPPAVNILTLDEAKLHCRVDFDDDDALIESLILAAQSHLDGYSGVLGRCLINQTWQQSFDGFRCSMRLPFPDVSSVTVKYFDANNAEQTLTDGYELIEDGISSIVKFNSSFSQPSTYSDRGDAVKVEFVAGYGATADDLPPEVKVAANILVGYWYEPEMIKSHDPMALVDAITAPLRRNNF